jgi:glycosyltransferase involved in cell wall biosynthesis/O-antigen/teichoic acid export membrane protein
VTGDEPPAPAVAASTIATPRTRLVLGTALLWLESALRLATVAAIAVMVARAVGPAAFGLLNVASALAAVGTVALSRGLEWPLISALASGRLHEAEAVPWLLRVRLGTALAALALATIAALLLRPDSPAAQAVIVIVAASVVAAVPMGAEVVFRARAEPLPGALARLVGTGVATLAKLAVVAALARGLALETALPLLALCIVLESAVASALLWRAWQTWGQRSARRPPGADAAIDLDTAGQRSALAAAARPLWASALVAVLLIKLDLLIVGALLGDEAAGTYAVAAKWVEVLCLLPVLLLDQWQPLRLAGRQTGAATDAVPDDASLFDTAFAFGVAVAVANLVSAPWLVPAVFGAAYAQSVPLVQLLGLAVPLIALDAARQRWLAAQTRSGAAALPRLGLHMGLALLVALPLWPLAVAGLGAIGAAAVSLGAWAVATLLAPTLDRRSAGLAGMSRRALWPWGRLLERWRDTGVPLAEAGTAPGAAPRVEPGPGVEPGLRPGAAHGLRALFVHQAADLYGSDRALLGTVRHWVAAGGQALVVLPLAGPLVEPLQAAGAEVHAGCGKAALLKLERSALRGPGALWLLATLLTWAPLRALDRAVAGRRIDLVHSQTLAVLAGAWWARRRRVPHLWHVHEIVERPRWLARALPALLARGAERVVCNAHATAAWVLGHQPGLRERLAVVWNSLDGSDAWASPDSLASSAGPVASAPRGGPHTPLRIGLIGRINRMKGQGVLIEAAEMLFGDARLPPFEIVIAGDAPPGQPQWRRWLEQRVAGSPLAPHVELPGFVADVPALLATLDVLVVPSTAAESFGLVALEAMAAGVPVVASRIGGLPEVLGDGDAAGGVLVPAGDARALAHALHELLRDGARRRRLGEAGRQRSRREFAHGAALLLRQQLRAAGRSSAPETPLPSRPDA